MFCQSSIGVELCHFPNHCMHEGLRAVLAEFFNIIFLHMSVQSGFVMYIASDMVIYKAIQKIYQRQSSEERL